MIGRAGVGELPSPASFFYGFRGGLGYNFQMEVYDLHLRPSTCRVRGGVLSREGKTLSAFPDFGGLRYQSWLVLVVKMLDRHSGKSSSSSLMMPARL